MISLFLFSFFKLWFTKQAHTVDWYIWFQRTLWRMLAVFYGERKSQCTNKKAVVKSSRNIYKLSTNGSKYKRATAFRDYTHSQVSDLVLGHHITVFQFCDRLNEKLYINSFGTKIIRCKPIASWTFLTFHFGKPSLVFAFNQ